MEKVAVLPVPDWAWAITSRPWVMGRIARCWIAEGFSKSSAGTYEKLFCLVSNDSLYAYMPRRRSSFRPRSSKVEITETASEDSNTSFYCMTLSVR